ncbi:hypothetical protein DFQ26_007832 [Actinomortierella ambigua]|nr:hypothetical protein DFQ26_007832 [Actinomortierella ambigua]
MTDISSPPSTAEEAAAVIKASESIPSTPRPESPVTTITSATTAPSSLPTDVSEEALLQAQHGQQRLLGEHADADDEQDEPYEIVRALYPFESEDKSSLQFDRDALILVYTKLESGWWYGFCNGECGWFPSNFVVQVPADEMLETEDLSEPQDDQDEGSDNDTGSEDLWLPQTTPDGQVFYFNTRTGESSWTVPTAGSSSSEEQFTTEAAADSPNGGATKDTQTSSSGYVSDGEDPHSTTHDRASSPSLSRGRQQQLSKNGSQSKSGSDAASRRNSTRPNSWLASSNARSRSTSPISHTSGQDAFQGAYQTPTLATVRKPSGMTMPTTYEATALEGLPPLPPVTNPFDPEPTWTSLAEHVSMAISNLLSSAEHGYKPYYQIQSSQIVEAIRVMLYASGTVDKDSVPIRTHRPLKLYHRQIMAALSKLVLSAKMASSVWPSEAAVAKMQADAADVAQAVRLYIETAQASQIPVHDVDAKLILDPNSQFESKPAKVLARALSNASSYRSRTDSDRHSFGIGQTSSSNIIAQLEYYSKSALKTLSVLTIQVKRLMEPWSSTSLPAVAPASPSPSRNSLGSITSSVVPSPSFMNSAQSAQLVSQCQQTTSQLGSLLTLVSELYSNTLADHPTLPERVYLGVRVAKQSVYNSIAALVMAVQLATDPMAQTAVLDMILEATITTEEAATELVKATRSLVDEKEDADIIQNSRSRADSISTIGQGSVQQQQLPPHLQRIESEIDAFFEDGGLDLTAPVAAGSTRHRSNSQMSSFSTHSSVSAPTTPGTEYTGRTHNSGYPFPSNSSANDGHYSLMPMSPNRENNRGEKLKKMLGDDAPAVITQQKSTETPWFLGYDYSIHDISFNMEGHVKGGTLPALVERLTLHDTLDSNFIATFLLTYRSFASTEQFFTLLFRRFTIMPPPGLEPHELELWTEKKLTPIRLRVVNIIKQWLENYFLEDETEDRLALVKIKEFSESALMRETMSFPSLQLIKLVERREASDVSFRKMILNLSTQAPPPITPRNLKKFKFIEIDPLEMARQLTIMESAIYNKIKPVECLGKAWASEDPDIAAKAVNIKKMIDISNSFANWISELMLTERDVKKRVGIIKHLIVLAEKLRQLNNFSMLAAATAALSSSPIHRLRRTWELVPTKSMNALQTLQQVTSSAKNWAEYRQELHSVNPPCVPFVGVYLTDLVMIQDGNPDYLRQSNHHINFYKRVSTAEVIREIQQYQSVPYCLTAVPEIQTFIRRGMTQSQQVQQLYDMSLELEPRARPMTGAALPVTGSLSFDEQYQKLLSNGPLS